MKIQAQRIQCFQACKLACSMSSTTKRREEKQAGREEKKCQFLPTVSTYFFITAATSVRYISSTEQSQCQFNILNILKRLRLSV